MVGSARGARRGERGWDFDTTLKVKATELAESWMWRRRGAEVPRAMRGPLAPAAERDAVAVLHTVGRGGLVVGDMRCLCTKHTGSQVGGW